MGPWFFLLVMGAIALQMFGLITAGCVSLAARRHSGMLMLSLFCWGQFIAAVCRYASEVYVVTKPVRTVAGQSFYCAGTIVAAISVWLFVAYLHGYGTSKRDS